MRTFILILILTILNTFAESIIKSEFDFANKLAKEGLWKEAYFKWQRDEK